MSVCRGCLDRSHGGQALLDTLRDEIRPALSVFSNSGELKVNMAHLLDAKSCPLLASIYEETVRFTDDALGVRFVQHETRLSSDRVLLRAGRTLLMPYREIHFDGAVFGRNADVFDPFRFMPPSKGENRGEKQVPLSRSASLKPFGGGNGFCPGRFLALRQAYMLTALFLFRFDVRFRDGTEDERAFPVMDVATRTGGRYSAAVSGA